MSEQPTAPRPVEGSRCVAGPENRWVPGRIRRVNEDGTFTFEPDQQPVLLMPYWYGVTPAEVSFADEPLFARIFDRVTRGASRLDSEAFFAALQALGFVTTAEQSREFWADQCAGLPGITEGQAAGATLDTPQSYQLFLAARVSARQLESALCGAADRPTYYKHYWNLTRMGGRDPGEVRRPVTRDDALAAVGAAREVDDEAVLRLKSFEVQHQVRLPEAFTDLFSRRGIEHALKDIHPNNPDPALAREWGWELQRDLRKQGVDGEFGLLFMVPHPGDQFWVAAFDDGDSEPRIYLHWSDDDGDHWRLTAPTLSFFLWDLAQTGLAWHRETGFADGPRVRETDIGLAVAR